MLTSGEQGSTVKEYRLDFAADYSPSQILSEGEQNVCAIADFLTEIQLDAANCGIIFDDPVTSLDHERKGKIAARLVDEAKQRQVVIFSHDVAFMSQLARHASDTHTPLTAHWMKKIGAVPGCVEHNTSPKLATLARLKRDSLEALSNFDSLGAKEQERALDAALGYLRSACEAIIEENLFANAIQRYDDHVRVQSLEEAVFDQSVALSIVDLHGRISERLLAHNRSDQKRESALSLSDVECIRQDFSELEARAKELQRAARKEREVRKKNKETARVGW